MWNQNLNQTVHRAVNRTVYWAVNRDVYEAVDEVVYWAVYLAVAVAEEPRERPPHPGLALYSKVVV